MESITAKGYAAELIARADLILRGLETSQPDIPTTEYDFVVNDGRTFRKVQVKGSTPKEDGKMQVDIRRSKAAKRVYNAQSFDILAIVNLETKEVAWLDYASIGCPTYITLRTKNPNGNGYQKGQKPNMFSDYLTFPVETGNQSA